MSYINPYIPEEKDVFLKKHMRLVHHFAHKYESFISDSLVFDYDDLASAGALGLVRAYNSFEPDKARGLIENAWSTYAGRCISNEILLVLRKHRRHALMQTRSLDSVVLDTDDGLLFGDTIEDTTCCKPETPTVLKEAIAMLPDRQREVLKLVMAGYTQIDVCEHMGLSQSYVSRLQNRALASMQVYLNTDKFKVFKDESHRWII